MKFDVVFKLIELCGDDSIVATIGEVSAVSDYPEASAPRMVYTACDLKFGSH